MISYISNVLFNIHLVLLCATVILTVILVTKLLDYYCFENQMFPNRNWKWILFGFIICLLGTVFIPTDLERNYYQKHLEELKEDNNLKQEALQICTQYIIKKNLKSDFEKYYKGKVIIKEN